MNKIKVEIRPADPEVEAEPQIYDAGPDTLVHELSFLAERYRQDNPHVIYISARVVTIH